MHVTRWPHLLVCAALCACGGSHQAQTLVRVEAEAAGLNCEFGGTVIHSGVDSDHDGTLDDDEITSSQYICTSEAAVKCHGGVQGRRTDHAERCCRLQSARWRQLHRRRSDDRRQRPHHATCAREPRDRDRLDHHCREPGARFVGRLARRSRSRPQVHRSGQRCARGYRTARRVARFDAIAIVGNDALLDLAGPRDRSRISTVASRSRTTARSTSLHGLDNLAGSASLQIRSNRSLTSLAALANLRSAVLIDVSSNSSLPAVQLPRLEKVDVYLFVKHKCCAHDDRASRVGHRWWFAAAPSEPGADRRSSYRPSCSRRVLRSTATSR